MSGLLRLATLSNGEGTENPRWYRRILRKLRIIQRSISRKKLGGSNRRKTVRLLQRLMVRVANTRKDFINKFVDESDQAVRQDRARRSRVSTPWHADASP